MSMYTMIIEQTKEYSKRIKYNPESGLFFETEYESLFHVRNCPFPYGWIQESGTPPNKHLDVILVSSDVYSLGDKVAIKLIGVFRRNDGDHKLVAVLENDEKEDFCELSKLESEQLHRLYPNIADQEGWFGKDQAEQTVNEFLKILEGNNGI